MPKPDKILKYMGLAWELVHRGRSTQRELQVVAGGLVYMAMFRRQLLGGLNAVWRHIEELKHEPPVVRRALPREVKGEILRVCGPSSSSPDGFSVEDGTSSVGQ